MPKNTTSHRQPPKNLRWPSRRTVVLLAVTIVACAIAVVWILGSQGVISNMWATIISITVSVFGTVFTLLPAILDRNGDPPSPPIQGNQHMATIVPRGQTIVVHLPPEQFISSQATPVIESTPTPPTREENTLQIASKENDRETVVVAPKRREDWGESPDIIDLYGREQEQELLEHWTVDNHCRVVAIIGIGGVGKTTLAVSLAHKIEKQFDHVFWRSLYNAPPLENILEKCILLFSNQQAIAMPQNVDEQVMLLVEWLRTHRCLLILDNFETILQAGSHVGQYLPGYEGYGKLLQRIGESRHQSCLLLTSREKPTEIAHFEGGESPVRSLQLFGLEQAAGHEFLKDKALTGPNEVWSLFINRYSGNPLELKIVSAYVRDAFNGDIAAFLREGEIGGTDIYTLLDQQFQRLSEREQDILYWLAIEREPIIWNDLRENLALTISRRDFLDAITSLKRRSFVETGSEASFSLQPVVMEYITNRFIEHIQHEIVSQKIKFFGSHALIKAQATDYVRNIQIRLILAPIAQRLLASTAKEEVEKKLQGILAELRKMYGHRTNYAAGNILNLLIQLHSNLRGYDFSHLVVQQAYLKGVELPLVNFAHANLAKSFFTETFGSILAIATDSSGQFLAAGTVNGDIRMWQVADGKPLISYRGHTDWVVTVAFNQSGDLLASGSDDQTVRIWRVSDGKCIHTLNGHTSWVRSVAFHPGGELLASGSEDQTIRLWDIRSEKCISILQECMSRIRTLAFSPDGTLLASGSDDQLIRLWEFDTGRCHQNLQGHTERVRSVTFTSDGNLLASGSDDHTVRIWEVSSGLCLNILQGHTSWIRSVAFSPDNKFLASGGDDHTIRIWEISSGLCLNVLQGHTNIVESVAFGAGGKAVVSGSNDETVRIWSLYRGECLNTIQGHSSQIWSIAFNADGQILASGGHNPTLCLWDINSGQRFRVLNGHTNIVEGVDFSPDGQFLVSGSHDQFVRFWKVSSGECLQVLQGHTDRVWPVAISPDGSLIASASEDQTIRIWEANSGRCLQRLSGNWTFSVKFSPDGQILASGGDDQFVRLWEISTGRCVAIFKGHTNLVRTVAFNSDGTLLASGGEDTTIKLWDVASGNCLNTMVGHTSIIRSVAFDKTSSYLASGSHDQTVRLWKVSNGQLLRTLEGHRNWIWSIAFNPDGKTLASGSHDGTIKLWSIQTGTCIRTLQSERPYEGMNIAETEGLTQVQRTTLKALGAIEIKE